MGLKGDEDEHWKHIANDMYLPFDASLNIYLQQDNFLDKEMPKYVNSISYYGMLEKYKEFKTFR